MNNMPLACDMTVFTPTKRDQHVQATRDLLGSLQGIQPVKAGFEFLFASKTEIILQLAEFIANERKCCPFLEFRLNILPNEQPISLTLTGPEGTPEFLREEFSEAFA